MSWYSSGITIFIALGLRPQQHPLRRRGAARLFRLARDARAADSPHSLGPVATWGCSVAPAENPAAAPHSSQMGSHMRPAAAMVGSRPQQSSLNRALKCILQIAWPAILVPIVLAQLLEPPFRDAYARVVGGAASPYPDHKG